MRKQGLKPHRHQYFESDEVEYHDNKRGHRVKKIYYRCMICGKEYYDTYECSNNVIMDKK